MASAFIRPRLKVGPNIAQYATDDLLILDELNVEVASEETHEQTVTWTSHPMEVGVNVSDHATVEQARYNFSGIISNTPINSDFESPQLLGPDRVQEADEKLLAMLRARQPVTIVTGLRVYPSLGIESYTVTRTPQTGQALFFSLGCVEVRFAVAETVVIPPTIIASGTTIGGSDVGELASEAAPETDAGTQTGEESTFGETVEERDKSLLATGFDALGNTAEIF